jgi:hypothetical protein
VAGTYALSLYVDREDAEALEFAAGEELVADLPVRDGGVEHRRVGGLTVREFEDETEAAQRPLSSVTVTLPPSTFALPLRSHFRALPRLSTEVVPGRTSAFPLQL